MNRFKNSLRLITVIMALTITINASAEGLTPLNNDGLTYTGHLVGSGASAYIDYVTASIPNNFSGAANFASQVTFEYTWSEKVWDNNAGKYVTVNYSKNLIGTVTIIGNYVNSNWTYLSRPGVTSINIPNTVTTIRDGAFYGFTGLTSITIPYSVINLGEGHTWLDGGWQAPGVFQECTNLTNVSIPSSVTSISSATFYGCTNLKSITIPSSVTSIGCGAFCRCTNLTNLDLGNSVTDIGANAFDGCSSLRSVTIPSSVNSIGAKAFGGCTSINRVYIDDLSAWCKINFSELYSSTYGYYSSNPLTYSHRLFLNGREIIDLVIPEDVTTIGNGAFYSCTALESVTIPNSVTSIGGRAFYQCTGLTTVTIGDTISSVDASLHIGKHAFFNCTALNNLLLGCCVYSIGDLAFGQCTALSGHLNLPCSLIEIGPSAFTDCTGLTSVNIPSSVQSIQNSFYGCDNLKRVNITDLDAWCRIEFTGFYAANPILGQHWNLYLKGELITDLVIPNTISEIKHDTFCLCNSIQSVTIPNSVTDVGFYAFAACPSLETLYLGNSVEYLRSRAFSGCNTLSTIYSKSEIAPSMDDRYCFIVYNKATVYVPIGSKRDYELTNYWNLFTNIVEMNMDETPPGDANGDGEVNIADISALVDVILSGEFSSACDVNDDGEINIADINAIIDIILNQ